MNVKLFASVAVIALTMCALGGIVLASDNSDAATGDVYYTPASNSNYVDQGTANNPITDFTKALPSNSSSNLASTNISLSTVLDGIYVYTGSDVRLEIGYNAQMHIFAAAIDVTSGYGVSVQNPSQNLPSGAPDWAVSIDSRFSDSGSITGTFSKAGDVTITYLMTANGGSPTESSFTVHVVDREASIDFTSPKAVTGISGGSINYTAQTNISATFSEAGGTGASWLNVNSSSGNVTGTFPSVSSMTSYTYIIKATSSTNASNTTTQTITINVYPVAQISATSTSISGTEGEAISSVTLTGNLDMTFSKVSGAFPAGVTMTSAGVISGTPTEDGSFTVKVQGTLQEGPYQAPTITIRFNIQPAEETLNISIADPAASYKVGESISLALTSNVSGTTWKVSGTAASFMSVSGSSVVGSVPSSYSDVTEVSLTVTAETPKGQTASKTVNFSVEPVISFTTVPTADCIITPVYDYNEDGTPVIASKATLVTEVWADGADFSFTDTLTICGTFTGTNAETVTWYWGDGSSDVGNKVNHTYEEPGTYEIRLVASNDLGDSEVTITVTVGDTGNDLLYYGIIVVLAIIVVYLAYRVLTAGKRRSH